MSFYQYLKGPKYVSADKIKQKFHLHILHYATYLTNMQFIIQKLKNITDHMNNRHKN